MVALDADSKEIFWNITKEHLKNKGLVIFTSHQNDAVDNLDINILNLDNFAVS